MHKYHKSSQNHCFNYQQRRTNYVYEFNEKKFPDYFLTILLDGRYLLTLSHVNTFMFIATGLVCFNGS